MTYKFDAEKALKELLEEPVRKTPLKLEELHVYKLADELSDYTWEVVSRWEYFAKKTVGDQWVRAADSVGANIAEGYGRYFFKENILFLYYARGSLLEAKWWAVKSYKRTLITKDEYDKILLIIDDLLLELNKVVKIIKTQDKKWRH